MAEPIPPKKNRWGKRVFTPRQWLRRDLRSAATRFEKDLKAGKKQITLAGTEVTSKES